MRETRVSLDQAGVERAECLHAAENTAETLDDSRAFLDESANSVFSDVKDILQVEFSEINQRNQVSTVS